jgi:hypothetical protein
VATIVPAFARPAAEPATQQSRADRREPVGAVLARPKRAATSAIRLFGAICPERAVGAAIIMPAVNTEAMNEHLIEISAMVSPDAHAMLVCDGAGWHQPGGRLKVPDSITLLRLPPYAPELNPMENVWAYLRANKLCNLVWNTYDDIVKACAGAWHFIVQDPERIQPAITQTCWPPSIWISVPVM